MTTALGEARAALAAAEAEYERVLNDMTELNDLLLEQQRVRLEAEKRHHERCLVARRTRDAAQSVVDRLERAQPLADEPPQVWS